MGVITQILSQNRFVFQSNMDAKTEISKIVGINISEKHYLLAVVTGMDTGYFLTDTKEYFTSLATDNRLGAIANGNSNRNPPKFANSVHAEILGIYTYDAGENALIEIEKSVPLCTTNILQAVQQFEFKDIVRIFGLTQKNTSSLYIGEMLYPRYSDSQHVRIPIDAFNTHTLISGTTGAGKSRLSALIANELVQMGREVSVFDPHGEYKYVVDPKVKIDTIRPKESTKYFEDILSSFKEPKFNEEVKTLIIDEVHTLFKDAASRDLLELLLRSSRKFGLATIFITQDLDDIPDTMRDQFQNQCSFREKKSDTLKYLQDQTCICSLRAGKVPFPMRVQTIELIKNRG